MGAEMQTQILINLVWGRASALETAIATMEELDASIAQLEELRAGAHVSVKVATAMKERNMTPQAVSDRTIGSQASMVSQAKFLAALEKVGFVKDGVTAQDVKAWFDDENGFSDAGVPNQGELKLVDILQAAVARGAEQLKREKALQNRCKELSKTASSQQAALDAKAAKEVAKKQRAEELRQAAEVEAAAKAAEAREAKRKAKENRTARQAEEKKAFEERVKRKSLHVGVNGIQELEC